MKFTDGFICVPVIMYDLYHLDKAREKEAQDSYLPTAQSVPWVEGKARIPIDEINGWVDSYTRGRTIGEVEEEGFDCCVILTKTLGEFICSWTREKLEKKLDEFSSNLNSELMDILSDPNIKIISLGEENVESEEKKDDAS